MKIDFWKVFAVVVLLAMIVFGYCYIQINRYYISLDQQGYGRFDNISGKCAEWDTVNKEWKLLRKAITN